MLIGRLGKDPETRYMPSGDAVCNFSIATSESWKDKNTGEKKESTEWHNIVAFGKLAEIAKTFTVLIICPLLRFIEQHIDKCYRHFFAILH